MSSSRELRCAVLAALALYCLYGCAGESGEGNNRQEGDGTSGGSGGSEGGADGFGNADGSPAMPGERDPMSSGGSNQGGSQGGSGVQPENLDHCPGPLSPDVVTTLQAGGSTDSAMGFLYPYHGTVFPRGLLPPVLQWSPATGAPPPEAVYLHLKSAQFEYHGCFGPTAPQLPIPEEAWEAAFRANEGRHDPLQVEITTQAGGTVRGPIALQLGLARANLKGAIYYNTYASLKAVTEGVLNGVVMRVIPGESEPEVFVTSQTPSVAGDVCVGCHSVSADGTRMVVEEHSGLGLTYNTSLAYGLSSDQAPRPPVQTQLGASKAGFSALYPDGSRYLTTGRPEIGPFSSGLSVSGTFGVESAALWDTDTGMEIPGSGIPPYAKMPMFNRRGDRVVFTDQDAGDALVMMDFDAQNNRFSQHRVIADDPAYVGWPFFLPDDSGVVFAVTDQPGYTTMAGIDLTGLFPNTGRLKLVDLESGNVIPLARAMGYRDQAMTDAYVPYGERDLDKDYIPTVSPVAAGGYFWLFFTSKRNYGNTKVLPVATADSKQIWVSALSIPGSDPEFDASQGKDPSHPPFRLPGQELESGNIRAFATLNPCKSDSESCETGIDCCSGFCTDGTCGVPEERCAEIDEACTSVDECCDNDSPSVDCIAGFCAYIPVLE